MFDPTTLVGFHTWLSLVGIAAGVVVVTGLISGAGTALWTSVFLITAILTSVTGYFLPAKGLQPSHIVGAVALLVLALSLYARFAKHLNGLWRAVDASALVASLYFLVFVAVAQAFLKIPALNRLAPTGGEPPFAIAQGLVLIVFLGLGYAAVRKKGQIKRAAL